MTKLKIEFFHNSVCSFCYIQSRRLQEILQDYPDAEVIHRSFPLNYEDEGIKQPLRGEEHELTIKQWQRANRVDEAKRFNVEGLKDSDRMIKPSSKNAEKAIKAAVKLAGEGIQWQLSDRVQKAYFEDLKDISDLSVLESLVSDFNIDITQWLELLEDPALEAELHQDFQRAEDYDLAIIPSIVINGETTIRGALRPQLIREQLDQLI